MKFALTHWKKNSIILLLGLSLGVVMLVAHYFIYWTDPGLLLNINFSAMIIQGIGVPILFMVLAALLIRKKQAGILLFGDSVKLTLMVFVLGTFVTTINDLIFYNVIARDFYDQHKEAYIQNRRDHSNSSYLLGLKVGGASEDKIKLAREEALLDEEESGRFEISWRKEKENAGSLLQTLVGFFAASLFGLLIALFISLFLIRKPKIQME